MCLSLNQLLSENEGYLMDISLGAGWHRQARDIQFGEASQSPSQQLDEWTKIR